MSPEAPRTPSPGAPSGETTSDHDPTHAITDLESPGASDAPAVAPGTTSEVEDAGLLADIASVSRYVLAVSYPVLAISTGARAVYRLFLKDGWNWQLGVGLSLLAAFLYVGATLGFMLRRRWAWWTSVAMLGIETILTVVVGTITILEPDMIGSTVWRRFGADYGYFPLFQPLLGLVWLLWPVTVASYGVTVSWLPQRWYGADEGNVKESLDLDEPPVSF